MASESQLQTPTVLVVEDEALLLFSIADDLRDAGFRVLEAVNADIAVSLLETHPEISILFTDVDMPGLDGIGLAKQAPCVPAGRRSEFS